MDKIISILKENQICELSLVNKFEINKNGKIDGLSFVLGFFRMLQQGKNSLEYWAGEIFQVSGHEVTAQGLSGKLQFRHIKFAKEFLKNVLRKITLGNTISEAKENVLGLFNNVYVEDSTCLSLPDNMFDYFPGTVNQKGESSSARIQLRMELKSGDYSEIELKSYRDNDQSYSGNILSVLKCGDLVLRDLGYWSLKVYKKIIERQAYLISRLTFQVQVFCPKTEERIDLYKKLRSLRKTGITLLDIKVLVGKKEKLPMRLIAIKVPQQVEQSRKRKMRKDKLAKRSDDYLEMLGWCIYITNIEQKDLGAQTIQKIYGFRWRIEIVFKCWKSKFNLYFMFNKKKKVKPPRVYISFYLTLVWLTLFFVKWYNYFLVLVFEKKNKVLSLFKFADFFKQNFENIYEIADLNKTITYLARYCSQQKRKRKSSVELIYLLNLP